MQKPTDGVRRLIARLRTDRRGPTPGARLHRRSVRMARSLRTGRVPRPTAAVTSLRRAFAASLRELATAERALPIAVAAIVGAASMLALLPSTPEGGVGGTTGRGTDVRIAIGGAGAGRFGGLVAELPADTIAAADPVDAGALAGIAAPPDRSFQPLRLPVDVVTEPETELATTAPEAGTLLDDGTLLTGFAPETTVEDGTDLIRRYKVQSGDTLGAIAHKFDVSMMTLWWANDLESKDDLHIGQVLKIPPVSGLVVTVESGDTLESLAAEHKVNAARIIELNGLEDPTLVIGQTLVLPGAKGEPIPTPKPTAKPKPNRSSSSPSRTPTRSSTPSRYTGGAFRWPVVGGGNYVSQSYHYGHYGLDIAADYGSPVVAAGGGRVTFAGWKSNGGGYQVWIAHGSGLYTTYNHMSSVSVGVGQSVGRGARVGRIGATGWATGPHLHFEVWKGPIWDGGTRVNPMRYF